MVDAARQLKKMAEPQNIIQYSNRECRFYLTNESGRIRIVYQKVIDGKPGNLIDLKISFPSEIVQSSLDGLLEHGSCSILSMNGSLRFMMELNEDGDSTVCSYSLRNGNYSNGARFELPIGLKELLAKA